MNQFPFLPVLELLFQAKIAVVSVGFAAAVVVVDFDVVVFVPSF